MVLGRVVQCWWFILILFLDWKRFWVLWFAMVFSSLVFWGQQTSAISPPTKSQIFPWFCRVHPQVPFKYLCSIKGERWLFDIVDLELGTFKSSWPARIGYFWVYFLANPKGKQEKTCQRGYWRPEQPNPMLPISCKKTQPPIVDAALPDTVLT